MLFVVVLGLGRTLASPSDVFEISAPTLSSDAPKATDLKDGDTTVSTQTGAAQYAYPVQVPPGRNGMAPKLALSYSSQAPLYGSNLGAGWSLNIPRIEEDTSGGRLRTHSPEDDYEFNQLVAQQDDLFVSSMAGGRRLVRVSSDPSAPNVSFSYRAQADSSFMRYQRMDATQPFRWRVLATDGTTMYFGDTANAPGCPISDGYAPLTREVDPFGNETSYSYVMLDGECMLQNIRWGQNANAGLSAFAEVKVIFKRARVCHGVEVGSTTSYRTGMKIVSGAQQITDLVMRAFEPSTPDTALHTRTIHIGYDAAAEACDDTAPALHAPIRLVTSIQESAVGVDSPLVTLPPVTFAYGPTEVRLDQTTSFTPWLSQTGGGPGRNLAWGFRRIKGDDRWPTVEAMIIDLDGDGLEDRLVNEPAFSDLNRTNPIDCRVAWQRNRRGEGGAPTSFATSTYITWGDQGSTRMPMLRWQGPTDQLSGSPFGDGEESNELHREACGLNGQITAYHNSHPAPGFCHDGTACEPDTACADGSTCPGPTSPLTPQRTYLAYRWLDADGDGLTDLVAAIHGSPHRYHPIRGNDIEPAPPLGSGGPVGYEPPLFGTVPVPNGFPFCPGTERCKSLGSNCMNRIDTVGCDSSPMCSVDWGDVNACLDGAFEHDCTMEIALFSGPNAGNVPTNPGQKVSDREPFQMCNGLFPWFIFKNRGNGNFADVPIIKYQPIPLESDAGDSSILSPGIAAANHGVLDLDGDGMVDGIVRARDKDPAAAAWWWFVWLNDGTGGLGPRRYVWEGREYDNGGISGWIPAAIVNGEVTSGPGMGLFDINADGLADHWLGPTGQTSANVAYNLGTSFQLGPIPNGTGALTTNGIRPAADSRAFEHLIETVNVQNQGAVSWVRYGKKYMTQRPFDLDGDGRQDMITQAGPTSDPQVIWNAGGQFMTTPVTRAHRSSLVTAEDGSVVTNKLTWQVQADFTDLDGDGLPESTYWNTTGGANQYKFDLAQGPPRLLRTVANGRGATTTILYASMHDATTVVQNPDETWPDGRPKASPRDQWVARSVSTVDTFASTTSTTTYQYQNPRFGPDDDGRHGFRGFEQVTTTSPTGMQTVQRYGYTPDWSGRLVATLVVPAEDPTKVRSIDRTTWEARDLSGTAVRTFHATLTEHFTCANDQDEITCTPSTAPAYRRTESTLTELPLTGPKMLWQETGARLQRQVDDADGDRETTTMFEVISTATTYRLRPMTTTKSHQVGGAMVVFGKSAQTWDPTFSFKLTDEIWFDGDDSHRAITGFVPDMATGNVIGRYKPKQNAAGTTHAVYTFDSRQLFVANETNELGHPFDHEYEYGTGTKLVTTGPNVRACTNQPSCVSDPLHPVREQKKIRVDGLGRPIERWETTSSDGLVYTLRQFGRTTYVDTTSGNTPTSVLEETELSASFVGQYKQERTELDGHGRPIRKILYAQGAAPADHITSFHYRNDGTLETVSVPDPTANDASVVTYTYGFDSLGRATSIRRPDTPLLLDQSGADIAYDGVTKTVSEVVRPNNGQAAVTRTITDAFGRLVEVDEQTSKVPELYTSTHYTYGPDDLVVRVVDPEQVTTDLVHDFAGHRIEIRRHGRTWKYGYDKNGNMASEQVPCSPNPCDQDPIAAAAHTTTTVYDDLDRPSSRLIAPRDLGPADRALFASDLETFTWDIGPNHKGYLRFWRAFAPNASTSSIELEAWNDNQGRRNITRHALTIAGLPAFSRGWQQNYRPFGGINATTYSDRFEVGGPVTTSTINYDLRGFPRAMQLVRGGLTDPEYNINIATLTRNVAGLVTKRRADTVTGTMDFIESNWAYDKLGRVSSQVVQKGPGTPTQVVRQDLTYFDNDDPKTLTHALGTNAKQFAFGYDLRHQLTSANETTTAGYFSSSYVYGTAGRFARATLQQDSPPPGSELRPRDVNYVYGDADPERVTALLDAGSAAPFSSYTYDAAGNRTSQCEGVMQTSLCLGESIDYVYDGDDHLRRATKKLAGVVQGSEEYWYDDAGQRIAIVRRDAAGDRTELVWFLGDSEAHLDGTGTLTRVYSHISLGTPVGRVDRTSNSSAPVEFQYHGLASSMLATVAYSGEANIAVSYSPFGEILAADSQPATGLATHRRRMNDKYVDEVTGLAYFGVRFFDSESISWTQADPLYRFQPERSLGNPRTALLYVFDINNPLRYVDPDGREVIQIGLNPKKAAQTRDALQEIAGDHGRVTTAREGNGIKFSLFQTDQQQRKSQGITAVQDLKDVLSSNQLILIQNVDSTLAADTTERTSDLTRAANAGLSNHGDAMARRPTDANSSMPTEIMIDLTQATSKKVPAFDSTSRNPTETEQTPGTVLGHELLAHAHRKLDEKPAREYENKHLRTPKGMKLRKTDASRPGNLNRKGID